MAIEKFKCPDCGTVYNVEWNEDAMVDYMEPTYCPFCGVELDRYHDEDYQEEWDE